MERRALEYSRDDEDTPHSHEDTPHVVREAHLTAIDGYMHSLGIKLVTMRTIRRILRSEIETTFGSIETNNRDNYDASIFGSVADVSNALQNKGLPSQTIELVLQELREQLDRV